MTDQFISILVVDDDQQLVELLSLALLAEGWWPLPAHTAAFALRVLETQHPTLVILDAELDGPYRFKSLRAIRERTDAQILLLSALKSDDDKVRAFDLGADDYISKPFGLREMLARIRASLRGIQRGN